MSSIREKVKKLLSEIPSNVLIVAACKSRTTFEVLEAINAGIEIIGHNYVQEAKSQYEIIGSKVKWHLIGHLQKNKVKSAIKIFDMIESLDSYELAFEIDKECKKNNKIMDVLIEVNSGREIQKTGVLPENVEPLIREISKFENIKIMGLMTMGPFFDNAEKLRPFFKETKELFEKIKKLEIPNVNMKYLSMGMSDSYKIAIEEGANIIRIGTLIFGERG